MDVFWVVETISPGLEPPPADHSSIIVVTPTGLRSLLPRNATLNRLRSKHFSGMFKGFGKA